MGFEHDQHQQQYFVKELLITVMRADWHDFKGDPIFPIEHDESSNRLCSARLRFYLVLDVLGAVLVWFLWKWWQHRPFGKCALIIRIAPSVRSCPPPSWGTPSACRFHRGIDGLGVVKLLLSELGFGTIVKKEITNTLCVNVVEDVSDILVDEQKRHHG